MRHIQLTRFDDFNIQQTSEPVSYLVTSERNAYGRYWFNGYDPEGEFYFGIGFGIYPNRQVMDGALSVVTKDGLQQNFRVSRHFEGDRTDLQVGPMRIDIVDPMREIHVSIDSNSTGISADLVFRAISPAHAEPMEVMYRGTRRLMEATRFTQFGKWSGRIVTPAGVQEVDGSNTFGVRDRSWGFRPVGEIESGAKLAGLDQFFWLWAPLVFEDHCSLYGLMEFEDGSRYKEAGAVYPRFAPASDFDPVSPVGVRHAGVGPHRLRFGRGTRLVASAEIDMIDRNRIQTIKLEPVLRFHQSGIGYLHPEWGHGCYKGELAMMSDSFNVNEIDKNSYLYAHVQQVVRAELDGKIGHGVLEQMLFGPHEQYGLTGFIDPPPAEQEADVLGAM